jgi:hypothetical protein
MLTTVGVCLLENLDGRSLRAAAVGATGGFTLVTVTALAVIPVYGAAGAVWALGTMELAQAIVLLRGRTESYRSTRLAARNGDLNALDTANPVKHDQHIRVATN